MNKPGQTTLETVELDQRRSDRLTVTLWWVRDTLETFVTVLDTGPEPPVEHMIDVPEGVLPMAVFVHPFSFIPADLPPPPLT